MKIRIDQTATTCVDAMDYAKTLRSGQREWTAKNLGLELGEASFFTKQDFEKALKKVARRIKK